LYTKTLGGNMRTLLIAFLALITSAFYTINNPVEAGDHPTSEHPKAEHPTTEDVEKEAESPSEETEEAAEAEESEAEES
jgi:hypothetical protein